MNNKKDMLPSDPALIHDIRRLIEEARESVAAAVNIGMTMLYWRIGKRIHREILKGERADYGKQILATLSQELMGYALLHPSYECDYESKFVKYTHSNLRHTVGWVERERNPSCWRISQDVLKGKSAEYGENIVSTLSRQLMGFAALHPSYECDYEFTFADYAHSNPRHTVGWVERERNPSRWQDGTRIREEVLKDNKAEYGKRIVHALSAQTVGWVKPKCNSSRAFTKSEYGHRS